VAVTAGAPAATPVLPLTRAVYVVGVCLTAGTGVGLFVAPTRTDDYWAWTIKAPLSAAFFGAGFVGAAVALALAARSRQWRRTRVVAIVAATLTSMVLFATLLHLDAFAFDSGGLREAVAVTWLAVYIALPPLALTAFVLQEGAGGAREYATGLPALAATRLALGGAGAVLGAIGIGLVANWEWLATPWPWPLPALPARVVGAWLCTYAAGFLWFALRDRDWRAVRIGVLPAAVSVALDLTAAVRLRDGFDDGAGVAVYVGALCVLLFVIGAAAFIEERRLRLAGQPVLKG
jgi:hypothetical protein